MGYIQVSPRLSVGVIGVLSDSTAIKQEEIDGVV